MQFSGRGVQLVQGRGSTRYQHKAARTLTMGQRNDYSQKYEIKSKKTTSLHQITDIGKIAVRSRSVDQRARKHVGRNHPKISLFSPSPQFSSIRESWEGHAEGQQGDTTHGTTGTCVNKEQNVM